MITELMNAMRHTVEAQGFPVKLVRLTRSQYEELVREIKANPRFRYAMDEDGEVRELNGARIEVV